MTNRGIETGEDYIGKRQKNHGVETICVLGRRRQTVDLKIRDFKGKKQKNHGVGTNCVFGRRRKLMGYGRTVDLKI